MSWFSMLREFVFRTALLVIGLIAVSQSVNPANKASVEDLVAVFVGGVICIALYSLYGIIDLD